MTTNRTKRFSLTHSLTHSLITRLVFFSLTLAVSQIALAQNCRADEEGGDTLEVVQAQLQAAPADSCPNPTGTVEACVGDVFCQNNQNPADWRFSDGGNCPAGYTAVTINIPVDGLPPATVLAVNVTGECSIGCKNEGIIAHNFLNARCARVTAERNCVPGKAPGPAPKPEERRWT